MLVSDPNRLDKNIRNAVYKGAQYTKTLKMVNYSDSVWWNNEIKTHHTAEARGIMFVVCPSIHSSGRSILEEITSSPMFGWGFGYERSKVNATVTSNPWHACERNLSGILKLNASGTDPLDSG